MPTYTTWAALSPDEAHQILMCVHETQKKLYRSAVEALAKAMGHRPNKILEMPKVERHAAWRQVLAYPQMEAIGFNFLCHWLVEEHGPLLVAWLDALGIEHDAQGMVEVFPPQPAPEALRKAVDAVAGKFDPRLVAIYLRTFNDIDGVRWPALAEIIESDPRLGLVPLAAPAAG